MGRRSQHMATSRSRWAKNSLKKTELVPVHKLTERRKEIKEARAKERALRRAFKGIYTYRDRKILLSIGMMKWNKDE